MKRGQKGKLQLAPELADEYNRIKQARPGWLVPAADPALPAFHCFGQGGAELLKEGPPDLLGC